MFLPYAQLMQDSGLSWSVYGGAALVLVVAVTIAVSERRERRRLERALATARQLPPFRTDPLRAEPPQSSPRLWLFPALAILLGLVVTTCTLCDVLR